jgi:hypothetical protein
MDKYKKKVVDLLEASGATMLRRKKHIVYRLSNKRLFVESSTPSDANSYKHAYSDLRRVAAMPAPQEITDDNSSGNQVVANDSIAYRAPIANRAPREDAEVIIPPLGTIAVQRSGRPRQETQFESVSELLNIADRVESFWNLTSDGQIRVLEKLAKGFANVEVLGSRSCNASFYDFEWLIVADEPLEMLSDLDWPMPPARSLYITTPDGKVQFVETETIKMDDKILDESLQIETWDEAPEDKHKNVVGVPDKYIFHHFIRIPKMRSRGLRFAPNWEWEDPKSTRKVIAEMLEALASGRRT